MGRGIGAPRVGIVGGGQLARMLAEAASTLAVDVCVLAGSDEEVVAGLFEVRRADYRSLGPLVTLAEHCDVVTFDHEHVPTDLVEALERSGHTVRPSASALRFADKACQRVRLAAAGLPVPRFAVVREVKEVERFAAAVGVWPLVLKPARGGYDGRGVHWVAGPEVAADLLGTGSPLEWVAEEPVHLDAELAVLVVSSVDGRRLAYPVVQTVQRDGICVELVVPAPQPATVLDAATELALEVAQTVGAVGVLAVELFLSEGRLMVNEVAPRPHNTGHYTIEAAVTSQFENHLRAVLGWPLGGTALRRPAAAMVNVLGGPDGTDPRRLLPEALAVGGDLHVHLYGKTPRPGRKLGHVTALGDDPADALRRARRAAAALGTPGLFEPDVAAGSREMARDGQALC
jgi:5-(carboxyamino)imidazole ribonucleotide synthase